MGLLSGLVKSAILAMALATWQLFLQPIWNRWIESQGRAVGWGETMLGYFIVIFFAWTLSAILTRSIDRRED
jgi:ABC-type transport system involved in cytochrome c biogenesis permease subunit